MTSPLNSPHPSKGFGRHQLTHYNSETGAKRGLSVSTLLRYSMIPTMANKPQGCRTEKSTSALQVRRPDSMALPSSGLKAWTI